MPSGVHERVEEMLQRAGLGEMSPAMRRGMALGVVLVVALAVWRFWPAAPAPEVPFAESALSAPTAPAEAAREATGALVVHVAGAIMNPGVYELPLGSRVNDAILAAGGALGSAETDALNLARLLADGEQVYVPSADEVALGSASGGAGSSATGAAGGGGGATASTTGLVNINTASVAELESLPGIGEATAEKIVADRETNGPFARVEDLMRVPGIGEKKFEALRDLIECR